MRGITADAGSRTFVIPCGDGCTQFGFDNCFRHSQQLAQLLGRPDLSPKEEEIGQLKQYEGYRHLIDLARTKDLGMYFDPGTPRRVKEVLEQYLHSSRRLRLFLGDPKTGRDWLDEFEVIGTIGRSMGPLKSPLLLRRGADGGPAILTECVVRILDVSTKAELYRHPTYHQAAFTSRLVDATDHPELKDYTTEVLVGGEVYARFKRADKADKWVAFMRGERMAA